MHTIRGWSPRAMASRPSRPSRTEAAVEKSFVRLFVRSFTALPPHLVLSDLMEGEPCLFIYDIAMDANLQRKGLGRHLMTMLELIARKANMCEMLMPIPVSDLTAPTVAFLENGLKGWAVDSLVEVSENLADAIDVALDDVAVESAGRGDGPLKVHRIPWLECAKRGAMQRLGHSFDDETIIRDGHGGQTHPVYSNRVPDHEAVPIFIKRARR